MKSSNARTIDARTSVLRTDPSARPYTILNKILKKVLVVNSIVEIFGR